MTTVTGILRDAQQNALPGLSVTLRYTRPLVPFEGGAAAKNDRLFTTDGSGELVMTDLIPGHYEISISVPKDSGSTRTVLKRGAGAVPDGVSELTLADFLSKSIPA